MASLTYYPVYDEVPKKKCESEIEVFENGGLVVYKWSKKEGKYVSTNTNTNSESNDADDKCDSLDIVIDYNWQNH